MKNSDSPRRKKAQSLLARHGYAVGGPVRQAIAAAVHQHERRDHKGKSLTKLKRGGAAEGAEPRPRADKPRRAAGGRTRKSGTKVIIVNGQPQPQPVAMPRPVPVAVPAGAAIRPPLAAARPPVVAPAPAGAAMPAAVPVAAPRPAAAKRGGRFGRLHMTAGSKNALGRLQKMKAYGAH